MTWWYALGWALLAGNMGCAVLARSWPCAFVALLIAASLGRSL
jgi:hypothetical protein